MPDTQAQNDSSFKRQVFLSLEDLPHARGLALLAGICLFVLISINAILVIFDSLPTVSNSLKGMIDAFGILSSFIFAAEYIARLWVADMTYPKLTPRRARLHYATSIMGIIDLLTFLPIIFVLFSPFLNSVIHMTYVVRLVRLFKLTRYMKGIQSLSRVFKKSRSEIVAAFTVLALLTITASVLMYEIENPVQPEVFDSVLTGMYWAITTITSTGFGDLVPITPLGRFVGSVTMVLSIAFVAIPAGIFSAGFVAEFQNQDNERRRLRSALRNKGLDDDSLEDDFVNTEHGSDDAEETA